MYENPNQQGQGHQYGQGPYEQQQYQPQYQQPYQPQYHGVEVKDFTPSAWRAALLGLFCVYPGLILAVVYLREASRIKKSTGVVPQGYGCLWAVFLACAIPTLLGLLSLCALVGSFGSTTVGH